MNALEKFLNLLRELFQFEHADLDFGLYRILNYKRDQIERFITKRLPQIVEEAFAEYAARESANVERELEETRRAIESVAEDAFDEDGQLRDAYRQGKEGRRYLELRDEQAEYRISEDLRTRIYNDLYTFFSRYYADGDFVSKRRYGRNETYAIPYKGEEVVLHWATKDQYYVKTGEQFKTYRFKAGDYSVAFETRAASTEQNSNQGKKRYFILACDSPAALDAEKKAFTVYFEYRPLDEEEETRYGKTEQQKPQDKLNEEACTTILEQAGTTELKGRLSRLQQRNGSRNNREKKEVTVLARRLAHFTKRNTSDFFIHKDLRGFLRRELDFFIKNEVLLLDELVGGGEGDLSRHIHRAQALRRVAEGIIDLLAQVEDFQKRLFEKKKFVVRTEYCATLDRVPDELWDEVLANEAQIAEWRELYALDDLMRKAGMFGQTLNKEFLREHDKLMVDTRHFPEEFKCRLLASFDDLDEAVDGVLIKSENFQGLNLLLEKYRESVNCVYIDPPFNTAATEILYKNDYKHSSWLSLIADRVRAGLRLMAPDSIICVAIDDVEGPGLVYCMSSIFGDDRHLATVLVRSNPHGRAMATGFSMNHEYALYYASQHEAEVGRLPRDKEKQARYAESDAQGRFTWVSFKKTGAASRRADRPKLFYPLFVSEAGVIRIPRMKWSDDKEEWQLLEATRPDEVEVFPRESSGVEGVWNLGWKRAEEEANINVLARRAGDGWQIYRKYRPNQEGSLPGTWWGHARYSATESGTRILKDLLGQRELFHYPKSVFLVADSLRAAHCTGESISLDYFAGSGTTAHAVINLNREDGGKRKYILVEMGDYFDTVMVPRIKKVVFCDKWKDGKPNGGNGISQVVKCQYLEQYEDALSNLELPRAPEGETTLDMFGDEYLLRYMLDFETQGSACLLNLEMFESPFDYRLRIQEGDELREQAVDLVETFNYLLGIQVTKLRGFEDNGRVYRAVAGEKNGKSMAAIWRPVGDLRDNKAALQRDRKFMEETVLPGLLDHGQGFDRLLVNGPCFVERAEAIEPEFHKLMFGGAA